MTMAEKLPTLADAALAALHANAVRLQETGTASQQTAAAELLPSIEAELTARRVAKLSMAKAAMQAKKAAIQAKKAAVEAKKSAPNRGKA